MNKKKIYFISDAHLGAKVIPDKIEHERKIVRWLDMVKTDAKEIFLLGDMFDFWFEYKRTVPKGFNRFLGKLAELSDNGIKIHFFTGNHDLWTFGYLEHEIGLIVHRKPEKMLLYGKTFFLAHGDGLNDNDKKFSFIRAVFHSKFCQFLFRNAIPANWGLKFGYTWSESNRKKHLLQNVGYKGENNEPLILFSKQYAQKEPNIDYYIFGHRHILLHLHITAQSRIVIIGDFLTEFSYAVFDGKQIEIHHFEEI